MFLLSDQPMSLMADAFKKASVSLPVVKGDVRLGSLSSLAVDLVNQTNEELRGTVEIISPEEINVADKKRDVVIPPLKHVGIEFKLKDANFALLNKKGVAAKVIVNGNATTIKGHLDLFVVPRAKTKINVDGDLSKYDHALSVPLNEANLFPVDAAPNKLWTGPEDLSCRAYCAYDNDNFYFGVSVKDDRFVQENTEGAIWANDCIQFAFDPLNNALSGDLDGVGYDADDSELGMALTKRGPQCFCWVSWNESLREKLTDFPLATRKLNKNEIAYEIAIPWEKISERKPEPGGAFKFNFIVLDCDTVGITAPYWLGLSPGIAGGKDPSVFKTFILMP
jgi:hypothetical protein